jgi:hypothetical protein
MLPGTAEHRRGVSGILMIMGKKQTSLTLTKGSYVIDKSV